MPQPVLTYVIGWPAYLLLIAALFAWVIYRTKRAEHQLRKHLEAQQHPKLRIVEPLPSNDLTEEEDEDELPTVRWGPAKDASADGGYLVLNIETEARLKSLCDVIGSPQTIYTSIAPETDKRLQSWIGGHIAEEAASKLREIGIDVSIQGAPAEAIRRQFSKMAANRKAT
ncbi:MAG TPA: hypothetical protein VKS60_11755 [Stellaceae bacterium]|nr:hypothetical protein [Stellaceae bacterium]